MSEKPILVTLSRGNPDDYVDFTDAAGNSQQRMGLVRCVPPNLMERTFRDLVTYVCDPVGSDGNVTYQGKERDLALKYMTEYVENPNGCLKYQRGGTLIDERIAYNEPISTHFGRMVEQKTIDTATGPVDCKSLDLILEKELFGGKKYFGA